MDLPSFDSEEMHALTASCGDCGACRAPEELERGLCETCARLDRADFMLRVTMTEGCWLWAASIRPNGYGQINHRGRITLAHRVAYTLLVGPIPPGMWVLHRCDVRACVNPEHLYLGTHEDNMRDMVARGRQCRGARMAAALAGKRRGRMPGESNAGAKLTDQKVRDMREAYAAGTTQTALAAAYGVRQSLVSRVVRREAWRHVE